MLRRMIVTLASTIHCINFSGILVSIFPNPTVEQLTFLQVVATAFDTC